MQKAVTVAFGHEQDVVIHVHEADVMGFDKARKWLDEQFIANECEPLRQSGKVLTADKVLSLATTVGLQRFEQDEAFRNAFGIAVISALGKPVVKVDVEASAVTY